MTIMPEIWDSVKRCNEMDRLQEEIEFLMIARGKEDISVWECPDDLSELPHVAFYTVGYLEPTHVLDIDGHWACMWTQWELAQYEDENGKEKNYAEYLSNSEYDAYIWTLVLQDASNLLNEGFFHSYAEGVKR